MKQVANKKDFSKSPTSDGRGAASTVGRGKIISLNSQPTFTKWQD